MRGKTIAAALGILICVGLIVVSVRVIGRPRLETGSVVTSPSPSPTPSASQGPSSGAATGTIFGSTGRTIALNGETFEVFSVAIVGGSERECIGSQELSPGNRVYVTGLYGALVCYR